MGFNIKFLFLLASVFFLAGNQGFRILNPCNAQSGLCDPNTPFYAVNLVGFPQATWVSSPPVVRKGNCCGTIFPDRCVEFQVTLDTLAVAINFQIASGAVPPGAMYYQLNCGPPVVVGQPICISGQGPHTITFCKPGANLNTYSITSISGPSISPNDTTAFGCTVGMFAFGLIDSTITWTSVFPGGIGNYNSYLSCSSGCDTTYATPQPGYPPFVDYQMCGYPNSGPCAPPGQFCDTVRVYFILPLANQINPNPASFCVNTNGVMLFGVGNGGEPPYVLMWTNGPNGTGTVVGDSVGYFATLAGAYSLIVTDATYPGCPANITDVTVTIDPVPTVNAGPDQIVCTGNANVNLSGTVTGASGGIWTGGGGTFNPNSTALNGIYTPNASEIASGNATLILTSTGNGNCLPVTDTLHITITPALQASINAPPIVCFGQTTSLTANSSGGTMPYTFLWNTGQTTQTITNQPAGTYIVTVTDATYNPCTATSTITITQNPQLTLDTMPNSFITCNLSSTINAVAGGGNGVYTYLWNTGATTSSITVNTGVYSITVTDGAGCSVTGTDTVLPLDTSNLAATINVPPPLCYGATTTLSVMASGGFGSYTYQWNTGATTSSIVVGAETYCAMVTDSAGCIINTCATVIQDTLLVAAISAPPLICVGANGLISVSLSGGQPPYTYLWNTSQTTPSISQPAGTYSVTVTDANTNSCTSTATISFSEESPMNASIASVNVSCFGGNNGSATLTINGGISPYSYSWLPTGQTTAIATGLAVGTYTVSVTDSIGCINSASVTITQPTLLTVNVLNITNVSCFGYSNGSAAVTASGGTPGYNYSWSPGGGTGATANNLLAENYMVTVTDTNGCTATTNIVIAQPSLLTANISNSSNVSCNGGLNGTATVTASGGTFPYFYSWATSPAQFSATATGLTAGNYSVSVTDSGGCTDTTSIIITQPAVLSTSISDSVDVSCAGGNDGTATASSAGGTIPFSYLWSTSPAQTTAMATGLAAGNYSVTISDSNGCSSSSGVTVNQPLPLSVIILPNTLINCDSAVDISASVSGGITAYSYLWNTGATTSVLPAQTTGTYIVTVTDANGCTALDTLIMSAINSTLAVSVSASQNICYGTTTVITANASGGDGNYSYLWNTGSTSASITSGGGTYCVGVTDSLGCITTGCTTVTEDSPLMITIPPDTICFGSTTSITANTTGGLAPYKYNWNTGDSTQSIIAPIGTYTVWVTDSISCMDSATVTISQASELIITFTNVFDVSCYNGNDGIVFSSVSGGVAPYSYLWSPTGGTTPTASGLYAGTYTLTVTDANGCTKTASVTITQPLTELTLTISGTDELCYGQTTGSAAVSASGGSPPYNYLWWQGDTATTINGLPAGTYSVSVGDTLGCSASTSITINQLPPLITSLNSTSSICGNPNGSASVTASGGASVYSYLWSNGSATSSISGVLSGIYFVTITDTSGCTATDSVIINNISLQINITPLVTNVSCNGLSDGAISIGVSGGAAPYSYLWSNSSIDSALTGLAAGTYSVTVSDSNGCSVSDTITVDSVLIVISGTEDSICFGASTTLNVIPNGPGYTYSWAPADSLSDTAIYNPVANPAAATTYSVTITDSSGCISLGNVTIFVYPQINLTVTAIDGTCNGACNGAAGVIAWGGTGTFSYLWNSGCTDTVCYNLCAGLYNVKVTDSMNCIATADVTVNDPPLLVASITDSSSSCNGACTGTSDATASGGIPGVGYNYSWNTTPVQDTSYATGLCAGLYVCTVTDSNNCSDTASVLITQPSPIVIAPIAPVTLCIGDSATLTAVPSGGNGGYTYTWSPAGTGTDSSVTVSPVVTTVYTINVTDYKGCTAPAVNVTVTVAVNPPLSVNANGTASICPGESTLLTAVASGGNGGPYYYTWEPDIVVNPDTGPAVTATPVVTTTYTVTATDYCDTLNATDSVTVTILALPDVVFNADVISGCELLCVNFTDSSYVVGGAIVYWNWDFGDGGTSIDTNQLYCFNDPGAYSISLTVTTNGGCSSTYTNFNMIMVFSNPIAEFDPTPNPATIFNPVVTFNNQSSSDVNYWNWNFGDGDTLAPNTPSPVHIYNGNEATYIATLIVHNANGCYDTVAHEIMIEQGFIFFMPNAFTPNNDHDNNIFFGKGEGIVKYELYIFDRWGDMIFYSDEPDMGWDGRANNGNEAAQQDVYVWMVRIIDIFDERHDYVGSVTLLK